MFNNRAVGRTIQERIRCGFGRLSQAVVHMENPYAFGGEHDDPFTPIIISQNSELTVCSGITMDEALLSPHANDLDEHDQPSEDGQSYFVDHINSNHAAAAFDHEAMTMPHNIQSESLKQQAVGHDVEIAEETKRRVKSTTTASTVESYDDDNDVDCLGLWPVNSQEEEEEEEADAPVPAPVTARSTNPRRNVSVKLEDFDFDHLTILQESVFEDDDEPCKDSEAWIIRKLERNAPELYWLQLTTKFADPKRLILAMQGNTAVRNVTVYPCALRTLSETDMKLLIDSICRLENLQNLIVFQDCGSLFVDPLIRHRPPLTRLTLYKLNFEGERLLSRLAILLLGLLGLEELSLEKYRGADGSKLLKIFSKVLPSLSFLRSLSLTPARGVKLSSDGPRTLFKALGGNNTLRTLSLQGSEDSIDQGCINELKCSLLINTSLPLEEVKLTGFWKSEEEFWKRFSAKSTSQIQYFLKLNKAGIRSLQLDVNADFETLRNVILRHRDNTDYIFYLILHNPSILNGRSKEPHECREDVEEAYDALSVE